MPKGIYPHKLHTEEHNRKIGNSIRGSKNGMYGKKHSLESLQRMSEGRSGKGGWINRGKKFSEEWRKKISETRIEKIADGSIKIWSKDKKLPQFSGSGNPNWRGGTSNSSAKRARRMNAPGFHTKEEFLMLKIKYKFMCLCCKKYEPEITLTEDHIIPLSRNGSDDISNVQPLCLECNMRKFTKVIDFSILNATRN